MKDLAERLRQEDQFGKYRDIAALPNGRDIQAVIRCSEDSNAPYLWQVVSGKSATYFKTLKTAKVFCRQRGWL